VTLKDVKYSDFVDDGKVKNEQLVLSTSGEALMI